MRCETPHDVSVRARATMGRAALPLLVLGTLVLTTAPAIAQDGGESLDRLAIVGGFLVDGTGGPPVEDAVVLLEGDRIAHVGTVADTEVPSDAEVVDASGLTVMPGLTDAHVHLFIVGHGVYSDYFQRYRHQDDRMREMMAISA
ncbi:MAG: amidohydrolase family protein, partial [Halobacteriales archaeon]|nr:amidohydrolase family protein [Halobacteriales archaeon]